MVQPLGRTAPATNIALINSAAFAMTNPPPFDSRFLDDLQARVASLIQDTPAADLQKNLKAVLVQQLARLDLVTREEFDTQTKVLARTRTRLEELEKLVAELERGRQAPGNPPAR